MATNPNPQRGWLEHYTEDEREQIATARDLADRHPNTRIAGITTLLLLARMASHLDAFEDAATGQAASSSPSARPVKQPPGQRASEAQLTLLRTAGAENGYNQERLNRLIAANYNCKMEDLTKQQASNLIDAVKARTL